MRKRTYGINVRVSKEEKERLEQMARRCGISLSAYLRRLGMGEDLSAPHPMERFENGPWGSPRLRQSRTA